MPRAARASFRSFRPTRKTAAPEAENARAIAAPMPDVAPVTITILERLTCAKILGAVLRVKFFQQARA
jgi:hypothetical protein